MSDPYLGEIRMFAGTYEIAGWAYCDGRTLPISEYETLFQLIGTTYGGDGQETFALPNLQSRFPIHQTSNNLGEMAGTEQETLTVQQIPVHNHTFLATTGLAISPTPGNQVPAQSGTVQLWTEDTPGTNLAPQAVGPAGGSQPHDNMHPYLVINFLICLFGTFPSPT